MEGNVYNVAKNKQHSRVSAVRSIHPDIQLLNVSGFRACGYISVIKHL